MHAYLRNNYPMFPPECMVDSGNIYALSIDFFNALPPDSDSLHTTPSHREKQVVPSSNFNRRNGMAEGGTREKKEQRMAEEEEKMMVEEEEQRDNARDA